MKLREIDKDRLVKIGAKAGNAYMYVGRMGDANIEEMDATMRAQLEKTVENAEIRVRKWKNEIEQGKKNGLSQKMMDKAENQLFKAKDALQIAKRNLKNFEPLHDRDVLETYESIIEPGVLCVLVSGKGEGKHWMIDEGAKFEINNTNGAAEVFGASLKLLCNSLQVEYELLYEYRKQAGLSDRVKTTQAKEFEVERAAHGLIKDPDSLLRMTRAIAVENLSYKVRGSRRVQVLDPKEVDETILTILGREKDGRPKGKG